MTKSNHTNDIADEALRKIGRNVVNVQKMEAMLKVLCSESNFRGPINEIDAVLKERRKLTNRKTMGRLRKEFVDQIHPNSTDLSEFPVDRDSAWVSISFKCEEKEIVKKIYDIFEIIVEERNRLIHTMLVDFDKNSIDSYRALIRDLDAQAEKILPAYKDLQKIGKAWSEGRKQLAKQILSEHGVCNPGDVRDDD